MTADKMNCSGLQGCFIEGQVSSSKTAYMTERETLFLPMACPRCRITGEDWFNAWRLARTEAGVLRGGGIPLFPALSSVGWSRAPIAAGAAADWRREVLIQLGFDAQQVGKYRILSCRATELCWLAKFGCAIEVRQLLGTIQLVELGNYGTLSRRATELSWLAKFGCTIEVRQLLVPYIWWDCSGVFTRGYFSAAA